MLLAAMLVVPTAPLRAADTDQLAAMQAERQKLEREAAQYRASIDLLKASGTSNDSPAITSLVRELGLIRRALNELDAREAAYTPPKATASAKNDPANRDAARIAALLKQHYAAEEAAAEAPAPTQDSTPLTTDVTVDASKVRLNGHEGVATLMMMSERLSSMGVTTGERDTDIVFSIEVRRDGRLVSKSSHSLQALGQSQYISKVSLKEGDARISVRSKRWRVAVEDGGEFLVTLHAPGGDAPRLHLIAVDELKATEWKNTPAWLPGIEAESPSRS